jgi:uncharacterized secreted protein with C-terminal beta-propeller domain
MKGKIHGHVSGHSKGFATMVVFFVLAIVVGGLVSYYTYQANQANFHPAPSGSLPKFDSCSALESAVKESQQTAQNYYAFNGMRGGAVQTLGEAAPSAAGAAKDASSGTGVTHSETNVQVAGVDEADIVKTDGEYIYTITTGNYYDYYGRGGANSTLVIAKAYPADEAAILSETDLGNFYPQEMFIEGDKILVFGSTNMQIPIDVTPAAEGGSGSSPSGSTGSAPSIPDTANTLAAEKMIAPPYYYPYRNLQLATVRIFDASDKAKPALVRSVDFEGNYLSSRKIGSYVYFAINSYPDYQVMEKMMAGGVAGGVATEATIAEILPAYRDRTGSEIANDAGNGTDFVNATGCDEVAYFEPVNPQSFITIASISMEDPEAEVAKEVIMGSGQNVYASLLNLYIAESSYPFWMGAEAGSEQPTEKTIIHKFSLENGKITYAGNMEAPGHILNQFSMDEYDSHFRIATTVEGAWSPAGQQQPSRNNIYVFGSDLAMTGKIEDIAPGESIYSARFMGNRGYLVTFKRVDPLFVLDLSDPANPTILGKLKIPGYSDYLHPYDENHLIGIGKEVDESIDADKVHTDNAVYYTAIQGVKMAIFDVTDVANPVEMYKVVIGDRGTDSYALQDHKAFLFDREKNLLVVPILLAEIPEAEKNPANPEWPVEGDYTFQGAYVYDVSLENGFTFKGRITHYDDNSTFAKSGYYYFGDQYSVKRSLYIGDVLYTVSGMKIKLNSLADLSEIKQLVFGATGAQ